MDEAKIEKAVIMTYVDAPFSHETYDPLRYVRHAIQAHPTRLIGFARFPIILSILILFWIPILVQAIDHYPWLHSFSPLNSLQQRLSPPPGFERIPCPEPSFAWWLRNLPLKEGQPPVHLFDGSMKNRQDVHAAVIDINVGNRNLQQCADAVIRLRAEYLYSRGLLEKIRFTFTSGDMIPFSRWAAGEHPQVRGNKVTWTAGFPKDKSYRSFYRYLTTLFMYAGTVSLARDMLPLDDNSMMQPGDVLIQSGSPGHAVLILDEARNSVTGTKVFLIGQSYMPAQEFHVLKNHKEPALSPWFNCAGPVIETPEWTFYRRDVRRFR